MSKIVYDDKNSPDCKDKPKDNAFVPGCTIAASACPKPICDPKEITEDQTDSIIGMALKLPEGSGRDSFVVSRMEDFIPTPYFAANIVNVISNQAFSVLPNISGDIIEMFSDKFDYEAYMRSNGRSLLVLTNTNVINKFSIDVQAALGVNRTMTAPEFKALIKDSRPEVKAAAFAKAPYGTITEDMMIEYASDLTLNSISNPNITVTWTPDFAKRFAESAGDRMHPEVALKVISCMRDPVVADDIINRLALTKDDVYGGTMDDVMKKIIINYNGQTLEDILKFASAFTPNVFTNTTIRNLITFDPQPSESIMLSIVDQLKAAGMQDEIYRYAQVHNMDSLKVEVML
jgi:hypothetical protein